MGAVTTSAPSAPLPDAGSTVAEIRAYADERGIALPARARKSELLEILREA